MAGSLEQAYRTIKTGDLPPVWYLTGEEDILKDELVDAVRDQVLDPGSRDFNLDVRSAADLDGEALHALVETPPMLAERRMVVIRGLDQWRKNARPFKVLHRYLEQPSPTTLLVLVQTAGSKPDAKVAGRAHHIDVGPLTPDQVRRWARRRAKQAGITLDDDGAVHLIDAVGGALATLAMELDKLAAAAPPDGAVTTALVAQLVGVRQGETLHDWVDAAIRRDVARAVRLLDGVLAQSGVSGVQMVMGLGTALTGVRVARALLDGSRRGRVEQQVFEAIRTARPARLRNWREEARRWTDAAANWTAPDLDAALAAALNADRALKSTTVSDERGILTTMLLTFTSTDEAAA